MCKFHQDIAMDVAKGADGTFDPMAFTLNTAVVGTSFSIGDYLPEMAGLSGYEKYKMASKKGQEAFARSGIVYDPDRFEAYNKETLPYLQTRTQEIIKAHPEKDGFLAKLTNYRKAAYFINTAPDELYEPFDTHRGNDVFNKDKDARRYQQLRLMASEYWDDPRTKEILTERFKQSIAVTFTQAKDTVNPTLLNLYEKLPDRGKEFASCAGGICTSAGGTLLGHFGCVAKATIIPIVLGGTASHDPALMFGMMGGGSALGLGAWEYMHYRRGTVAGKIEQFATYGASILSLAGVMAWHMLSNDHSMHSADHQNARQEQMENLIQKTSDGKYFWINDGTSCGPQTYVGDTLWVNPPKPKP